jgi:hypothetical protein
MFLIIRAFFGVATFRNRVSLCNQSPRCPTTHSYPPASVCELLEGPCVTHHSCILHLNIILIFSPFLSEIRKTKATFFFKYWVVKLNL